MDHGLLIGLNLQQSLRERMDVVANNLANMNTAAFKAEMALNEDVHRHGGKANDNPKSIHFTNVHGLQRDMRAGSLKLTGGDLDIGLSENNAFFSVKVGEETRYTRDGQFALDELSRLVTREGARVLDAAGAEIVFDPEGEQPTITDTGRIYQGDLEIAQLGIFGFDVPAALAKTGDNLYDNGDQAPNIVENPGAKQGFVEQSNVNAILEITRMIEISRAYTSASRLVKDTDELRKTSISKLGSAQ